MPDPALAGRLQRLGELASVFDAPDFAFGRWEGGDRRPDGVIRMPYYTLSPEAERFHQAAGALVIMGFGWPTWSRTTEFQRFDREPAAISAASVEQLRRLLTVYIRAERFGDGTLESAYDRGVLTAILRRAAALAAEARESPVP